MIVWYACNFYHGHSVHPNLFKTEEQAEAWCRKDSKRLYGKWVPDNYMVDFDRVE